MKTRRNRSSAKTRVCCVVCASDHGMKAHPWHDNDFDDDGETLEFNNIEVNATIITLDEELLSISEDFISVTARDVEKKRDLYSSYDKGEHTSGYFM